MADGINIDKLKELIERCKRLLDDKNLSEQDTKSKLIDPLLKEVLGWNEDFIVREASVETKDSMKRPDYWYPKVPKVIVEAKKLGIDLSTSNFDEQVQEYAYNKAVNIAILTNFRWFRAWYLSADGKIWPFCDVELTSQDLSNIESQLKWFSNENILNKGIDEEAKRHGIKTGEIDISGELTISINIARQNLNNFLKKYYRDKYSDEEHEEFTQGIINRLIFIKKMEAEALEDKQLEPLIRRRGSNLYSELKQIFKYYREEYDSDIFGKPSEIQEVEKLDISDSVINETLGSLSHPTNSKLSYNFAAIDQDILGSMYENYLAYIQKRAKLIGGKSHKKEQGIYYTPRYIVDYILQNTLGVRLKTAKLNEVRKLKLLDPACGSGSFLIAATRLLDEYYTKNFRDYENFSSTQKLNVIKENIFGVDLDEKAIKIAELNIYLTILTLSKSRSLAKGELLPILKENLKVGNSLIDDPKVAGDKAFNWQEKFKDIMKFGGFDIIIGNPPWSSKISNDLNKVITDRYKLSTKNINICSLFILSALEKLKPSGIFGFLLPKVVIKNETYRPIREKILNNYGILQIIDFGQFPGVASDAIGLVIKNQKLPDLIKISFFNGSKFISEQTVDQKIFSKDGSAVFAITINNNIQKILEKIKDGSTALIKLLKVKRGIELGQKSYIIKCTKCGSYNEAETKYYGSTDKFCKSCGTKLSIDKQNIMQISATKKQNDYDQECIAGSQLQKYAILDKYYIKIGLKGIDYKLDAFTGPKILIKRISTKIEGTYSNDKLLAFNTVYSIYGNNYTKEKLLPILAILNSRLMHFFYEFSYNLGMNLTTQITIDFLSRVPIKEGAPDENKSLANLITNILTLNARLAEIGDKKTYDRAKIEDEIKKTDAEIDESVYKIYGITKEEKKIVEDSIK